MTPRRTQSPGAPDFGDPGGPYAVSWSRSGLSNMRILVVEDEAVLADALRGRWRRSITPSTWWRTERGRRRMGARLRPGDPRLEDPGAERAGAAAPLARRRHRRAGADAHRRRRRPGAGGRARYRGGRLPRQAVLLRRAAGPGEEPVAPPHTPLQHELEAGDVASSAPPAPSPSTASRWCCRRASTPSSSTCSPTSTRWSAGSSSPNGCGARTSSRSRTWSTSPSTACDARSTRRPRRPPAAHRQGHRLPAAERTPLKRPATRRTRLPRSADAGRRRTP